VIQHEGFSRDAKGWKISGKFPETFQNSPNVSKNPGNFPEIFQKFIGNFPEIFHPFASLGFRLIDDFCIKIHHFDLLFSFRILMVLQKLLQLEEK